MVWTHITLMKTVTRLVPARLKGSIISKWKLAFDSQCSVVEKDFLREDIENQKVFWSKEPSTSPLHRELPCTWWMWNLPEPATAVCLPLLLYCMGAYWAPQFLSHHFMSGTAFQSTGLSLSGEAAVLKKCSLIPLSPLFFRCKVTGVLFWPIAGLAYDPLTP